MILIIKENGEALNLSSVEKLYDMNSVTGSTKLGVLTTVGNTVVIDNFSLQDLVDHTSGRMGTMVIRRHWNRQ